MFDTETLKQGERVVGNDKLLLFGSAEIVGSGGAGEIQPPKFGKCCNAMPFEHLPNFGLSG